MAPVEPNASSRNNLFAYAPFGGHIALVVGLTAHVLLVARRAAISLPPTTSTRSQQPLRRKYAIFFALLAALSLASVTTFAFIWRVISYVQWAGSGVETLPNGLWTGWYGTGEQGRWYLGDWIKDIDLNRVADNIAISTPEGFMYTSQHYIGLLASAIFFGVEGHRRSLPATTIASFVILGATGSLGYALSLFFVTILYTPLTVHTDVAPLHDALFAPLPVVYYVPIVLSLLFLNWLPELLVFRTDIDIVRYVRLGKIAVPLLLAFAPKIVPVTLGRRHISKSTAHQSYARVFHFLSLASFILYWRLFIANVSANTPDENHHIWDVFTNSVGIGPENSKSNRLLSGISATGQRLKHISKHPVISVTSLDVLFTTISLLAWTLTRNLDVESILGNSILAFLVPKHEKHVAFEDDAKRLADLHPEPEQIVESTTPRKRGRPAKSKVAIDNLSTSLPGSIKRNTERKLRSAHNVTDIDSVYQPTSATKRDVSETEADGATTAADLVHGGESTALALFLAFAGGLGQLAAGALGAEVTGPQE